MLNGLSDSGLLPAQLLVALVPFLRVLAYVYTAQCTAIHICLDKLPVG